MSVKTGTAEQIWAKIGSKNSCFAFNDLAPFCRNALLRAFKPVPYERLPGADLAGQSALAARFINGALKRNVRHATNLPLNW